MEELEILKQNMLTAKAEYDLFKENHEIKITEGEIEDAPFSVMLKNGMMEMTKLKLDTPAEHRLHDVLIANYNETLKLYNEALLKIK